MVTGINVTKGKVTFDKKKKCSAAMEEREEGSGSKNSDLITMIGNEARVCGEVRNNLKKKKKKSIRCASCRAENQLEDIAVCTDRIGCCYSIYFAEIDLGVLQTTCESDRMLL